MKFWQIALVSGATSVAVPAIAQMVDGKGPPMTRTAVETRVKERLARFDTDKNGIVTRDEMLAFAKARGKETADQSFTATDVNKDGSISRQKYDARAATRGTERVVRIDRRGADGSMPEGKSMRMMMMDRGGTTMMSGDGQIVIADAVKKALERFDATDTNKDGTISPEERRAAREARRAMKPAA